MSAIATAGTKAPASSQEARQRRQMASVNDELAAQSKMAPQVSILIPTRNEAGNVDELLRRLEPVVSQTAMEIIFVDDSTDNTPQVIDQAGRPYVRPVRLIHRELAERLGGLGGAVVEGMRAARGQWIVVMDGDLQHPPELIPQMLAKAVHTDADLVVASRYGGQGDASSFNRARVMVSQGSTLAAKTVFPRRLHGVDDPMSGFFLVRRDAVDLNRLRPNGFKILLEIIGRTPGLVIESVPFSFGERHAGESKASLVEGYRYLQLLAMLRLGAGFVKFAQFAIVGVSGLIVNTLLLAFWTEAAGLYYLVSLLLATQGSTLWNFLLSERWVFQGEQARGTWKSRGALFFVMNNLALLVRSPIVFTLTSALGVNYLVSNVISMVILLLMRYALADRLIWGDHAPSLPATAPVAYTD